MPELLALLSMRRWNSPPRIRTTIHIQYEMKTQSVLEVKMRKDCLEEYNLLGLSFYLEYAYIHPQLPTGRAPVIQDHLAQVLRLNCRGVGP